MNNSNDLKLIELYDSRNPAEDNSKAPSSNKRRRLKLIPSSTLLNLQGLNIRGLYVWVDTKTRIAKIHHTQCMLETLLTRIKEGLNTENKILYWLEECDYNNKSLRMNYWIHELKKLDYHVKNKRAQLTIKIRVEDATDKQFGFRVTVRLNNNDLLGVFDTMKEAMHFANKYYPKGRVFDIIEAENDSTKALIALERKEKLFKLRNKKLIIG